MNFTLDPTRHAAPQVVEALRAAIISLELAPGSALDRSELALRFGISQTPVRDALIRLAEEGLVLIRAQYTTQVSRLDVPAAREAHFLRRAIEIELARLLLSADPDLSLEDAQFHATALGWAHHFKREAFVGPPAIRMA